MKKLLAAALLSAAVAPAFAAPTADSGYYVGVDVGNGKIRVKDCTGCNPSKDSETVGGILLGYQYNKNLAVEVKYTGTGKWEQNTAPAGDVKTDAFALAVVGIAPINNDFSVYGKLGVANTKSKVSGNLTTKVKDARRTAATAGVGVQYNVTPAVGVRLGYDFYSGRVDGVGANSGSDADSDVWTVGVVFKF